ncbi:MFS transporter [Streptomyces goshikiensis]|uniref:MFS transporter n=1 Tax=Streptomyces goshikiensis TaxID=1942 RepID=UPI003695185F
MTLPLVVVGVFLSTLDFFVVSVAIPAVQSELHASDAAMQLFVAGYALVYGTGMITGGRLGDVFGRRRMFIVGMLSFTIASAFCGLATNMGMLLAARVLQGAAAALMIPQGLALCSVAFTGAARLRAISWYGAASGFAAVLGQPIAGLLIKADLFGLGWRPCFLVNLPVGLAAAVLARRYVPESRAPDRPGMDVAGSVLVTVALAAVLVPLVEGRELGWPTWTWLALACSGPLLAGFAVHQRRAAARGRPCLMDVRLFRARAFSVGLLAQLLFWAGMASCFFVLALYLQRGRGLDPLTAGLVFAVLGAGYLVTSTTVRRFTPSPGRGTIAVGALIRAVALLGLIATLWLIGAEGDVLWLAPGLFLDGAGMGLVVAPLATTVLARVSPRDAGAVSGVLSTGLQVGNALGVALVGLVFYPVLDRLPSTTAYLHAYGWSLLFVLALSLALVISVRFLPRNPPQW